MSYNANLKRERREKGLCTICGKVVDDNRYVMCSKCRGQAREDWKYYQSMRTCPKCRKNPLIGGEKMCRECKDKKIDYDHIHGVKISKEARKRYDQKRKESRLSLGLCPRCGKRKLAKGRAKCSYCLAKDAIAHRKGFDIRQEREERGLCRWCGKDALKSKKFCADCYERLCTQLKEARGKRNNDAFGKMNDLHFRRRDHESRIKATS